MITVFEIVIIMIITLKESNLKLIIIKYKYWKTHTLIIKNIIILIFMKYLIKIRGAILSNLEIKKFQFKTYIFYLKI